MNKQLLICIFLLLASGCSGANSMDLPIITLPSLLSAWSTVDKIGGKNDYLLREGDKNSLHFEGSWAIFKQRWTSYINNKIDSDSVVTEIEAINCLTGALGELEYTTTDLVTQKRIIHKRSFEEIEYGTTNINMFAPNTKADQNVVKFACTCTKVNNSHDINDMAISDVYETQVKHKLTTRDYHLRFMSFPSLAEAQLALDILHEGEKFATVVNQLLPTTPYPGGDLGIKSESSWTSPSLKQIFRHLKPGEYTKEPIREDNAYSLYYLEGYTDRPPESIVAWRPKIINYLKLAQQCDK